MDDDPETVVPIRPIKAFRPSALSDFDVEEETDSEREDRIKNYTQRRAAGLSLFLDS